MQKTLIFVAGMISGIALLFLGLWAWGEYATWASFETPDAKLVAHIDAVAAAKIRDWNGKTLPVAKYRRWYVQGSVNGHKVIWGSWDIPDPTKYSPGIILGHRFSAPGHMAMLGGGCSQVMVGYDFTMPNWVTAVCNAPE